MPPDAPSPLPSLASRVFSRPSSKLGAAAVAAMVGSIGLLFLFTAIRETREAQGSEDPRAWEGVASIVILMCILASYGTGLVAVFRKHERSWVVLLPAALISAAILNELGQGLVHLAGGSD